jgi:hypothetical protein
MGPLLMIALVVAAWSDDVDRPLPGSDLNVVTAGRQALYIVKAKIVRLGERRLDHGRRGGLLYPRVGIEPLGVIKGLYRGTVSAKRSVGLLLTQREAPPKEGETYILYIADANRASYVFKVTQLDSAIPVHMPGSAVNIAQAEREALYVLEAKVLHLGWSQPDPSRPRGLVYTRVLVEPLKLIKGTDRASGLGIREVHLSLTEEEADLVEGAPYTLYIRNDGQGFEVFRVTRRSENKQVRLPGNNVSAAEAESKALYVVEARILHLGELQEDHSRPRGLIYPRVPIEQSKVIKERHEGAARPGREVRLLLTEDETIPKEGETYNLYIRGRDRGFEVFKVTLPVREDRR